jgi:hypothetical protein
MGLTMFWLNWNALSRADQRKIRAFLLEHLDRTGFITSAIIARVNFKIRQCLKNYRKDYNFILPVRW